ncbi:Multifunctional pyrimidine synthesis protein CAD [Hanseniaspora vineae]
MFSEENHKAIFKIKNGPTFEGYSFGYNTPEIQSGEVVFTTSLVGYPESMSDPSYKGQILVFTQPLIGNYGVPSDSEKDEFNLLKFMESPHLQCKGIVVSDYAWQYSHWTAVESLQQWCVREKVAAIGGIDTRQVVQLLRDQGSTLGCIITEDIEKHANFESIQYEDPGLQNLVEVVSTKAPYYIKSLQENPVNVLLVDCGCKENIVRCLTSRNSNVTVVPYNYPIDKIAASFDGIFISNGPGDPKHCQITIENLAKIMQTELLKNLPIFGICLGHQLLSLAAGASTKKMKYGNRAHNIPTMDLLTGHCHITSQNHGYVVDETTLPENEFIPYFVNLNDKSNEGMIHVTRPIFSTQFHPEAKGGPLDTSYLFDNYFQNIQKYISTRASVAELPASLLPQDLPTERVE